MEAVAGTTGSAEWQDFRKNNIYRGFHPSDMLREEMTQAPINHRGSISIFSSSGERRGHVECV